MRRSILFFLFSVSVVTTPLSSVAWAQPAPGPCGRAVDLPGKLDGKRVNDFKSDPKGLLTHNPIGGLQLSSEVKGLAISDPSAGVDTLLEAAKSGNSAQAAAIGAGLGQAVKAIAGVDKVCADDIARRIAGTGLSDLLTAYNLAQTDSSRSLLVGSDVGAGAGVSGGYGGAVNTTNGVAAGGHTSAASAGSTIHTNTADAFSFSGATVTCSTSVSPRRQC